MPNETSTVASVTTSAILRAYALSEPEEWWRDQGELLSRHGYELRPRFRPGWTPSWLVTKKKLIYCEDYHANMHPATIDAKRVSDGKRVKIKKLFRNSKELEIARYLFGDEERNDPSNHCVPIIDVISEEGDPLEFMVMPLLLPFDWPPFSFVEEVVDFIKQTLEGLSFIHSKNVAHRDCSSLNIMMDGEAMFPKGFHPSLPILDASAKYAHPRRRREVGVKYYFTDFGISTKFGENDENRLVTGRDGQDQDVPELHRPEPYDPFPLDVFVLGNVYRKHFTNVYKNLSFLKPLVEHMTHEDPKDRPSASDALMQLNEIVVGRSARSLRWSLTFYDDSTIERVIWGFISLKHEVALALKKCIRILLNKGR